MWLSNRDFIQFFARAIETKLPKDNHGFAIINAMSSNSDSRWNLDAGKKLLNYTPQSNVRINNPISEEDKHIGLPAKL